MSSNSKRLWNASRGSSDSSPISVLTIACSTDGSRVAIGTQPLERLSNETIYDFVGPLWGKVITFARSERGHFSVSKRLPCSAQLNEEECGGNPADLFLLGRNDLVAVLDRGGLEPRTVVEIRKADSGQLIRRLLPPTDFESGVCFSAASRLIAWGCRGGRVRVCSFPGNEAIRVCTSETGHSARIDLIFSPDGRFLICGGAVHEPAAVSPVRKALGLGASSRRSPGKYLGQIEVWDVQTGKLIDEIRDSRLGGVSSFAFLNDRRTLIAGDLDGNVWFLNYRKNPKVVAPVSKERTSGEKSPTYDSSRVQLGPATLPD
jgi:WD40 repeat protein